MTRRFRGLAGVLLVVVAACSPASESAVPSVKPTGPLADVVLQPLPAIEDITFITAAEAELELIAQMRADAGFAEVLGPDGEAILAAFDQARQDHGEGALADFAANLGIDLSAANPAFAALPGAPAFEGPAARAEWSGSLLGETSATMTMVMALMSDVVKISDTTGKGTLVRPEHVVKNPTPDTTETIDITTTYTIDAGSGMISADVDIDSTDVITDPSGAQTAGLTATGHGHIDVNACPDANGKVNGTYEVSWEETASGASGSGSATTHYSNKAPFTIWNSANAQWTRVDTTMNVERGATGPGTASGDWNVQATVPMTITAQGKTVIGYDLAQETHTGSATATQVNNTAQGTHSSQQFLAELAKAAQRFYQSGACVELQVSPGSKEVDPEEHVSVSADAFGKFDHAHIAAPITAAFSGKASLEPANTPVDAPATFDFTAGNDPGDVGTITLKLTSIRGVGLATVKYKVKGGDLLVSYTSTLSIPAQTGGIQGTIVMTDVKLTGGSELTGDGTFQASGSIVVGPCSENFNQSIDATVTATRDEADENLLHVKLALGGGAQSVTLQCPEGLTYSFPFATVVQLWFASLQHPAAVPIDGNATVNGNGGSTTITVKKVVPTQ
jgi:hypothetical protein